MCGARTDMEIFHIFVISSNLWGSSCKLEPAVKFWTLVQKIRQALIVQNDRYIESSNLLTVIPIYSQITKRAELDVLLKKDAYNRLMTDSLLKTTQMISFDKRRSLAGFTQVCNLNPEFIWIMGALFNQWRNQR